MAKSNHTTDRVCIYCGQPAPGVREGEHILPQAIAGERTIIETSGRVVCNRCNNGPLSQIDNELCNRSYLALIASQEIEANLWQVWDVDHASGNQLVEARPTWVEGELQSLYCFPQLLFEGGKMHLRGDAEEFNLFGSEDYENVLVRAVHSAFQRFKSGDKKKKGLIFEQIDREMVEQGYRLDPRVFTRHTIAEIASKIDKQTFTLRYTSNADKRAALSQLDRLEPRRSIHRWGQTRGSRRPPMASTFDLGKTTRGLMKIGFNILAAYCSEKTLVDRSAFSGVIKLILGNNHPSPQLLAANGFVHAADLADLKAPDRGHAFRLTWFENEWRVYASFFGGRLSAAVKFPGPNREDWSTLEVVAPLGSKDWKVTYSKIVQPIRTRIQWSRLEEVAPTIKLQNSYATLTAEEVPVSSLRRDSKAKKGTS